MSLQNKNSNYNFMKQNMTIYEIQYIMKELNLFQGCNSISVLGNVLT